MESFAHHNLGSDTLLVIRDTYCCHATMVNRKGPFVSVTPQKAGVAYGTPNLPRTPWGPRYFWTKEKKNTSPNFPLRKWYYFGLRQEKWGITIMETMCGHSTWSKKSPHHPQQCCRGQDLALVVPLAQGTAVHRTLIYSFWGLLAASRPKTPPHNEVRYWGERIQQFAVKCLSIFILTVSKEAYFPFLWCSDLSRC